MSHKIVIVVGEDGRLEADFVAYIGNGCREDENRLRDYLARYGLRLKASVTPKSEKKIAEELRQSNPVRRDPCHRIKT